MNRSTLHSLFASALLIVFAFQVTAAAENAAQNNPPRLLRAGAATADITPPLGLNVVGGFVPHPSTNIHDRLHARCLVLDNGNNRIAFAICDNLGISTEIFDAARKVIAEETSFPPENILMAATHTHSGSHSASSKLKPILIRGIADALQKALKNLEPAKIGWGGIDEPSQVFNRRWYVTDPELLKNPFGGVDQVRMNPPPGSSALVKPAGPIDPEISFLSVQSTDGRPIALLANYSLHYVGGVQRGDLSADYFGIFSRRISELLGADSSNPPFVGMLSNGTSGDINNINFREKYPRRQKYEQMTKVAELVAQRVHEAHAKIDFHNWVPLGSATRELTLKMRKPDQQMQDYFAKVTAQPEDADKYHRYERSYAGRVQRLLEGPDEVTVPLQAVRIGDLGIAAIPFEVFAETGLEIKQKAPFGDAFTIELANGTYGYLPTPPQHELGGYETWMGTNRVQLDASVLITQTILDLMHQLKGTR